MFLDSTLNWADRVPVIVTGGQDGMLVKDDVIGLSFKKQNVNGTDLVEAHIQQRFPSLPTPRYLHQTQVVRIKGQTYLLALGGKASPMSSMALDSVIKLNIHTLISKTPSKAQPEVW